MALPQGAATFLAVVSLDVWWTLDDNTCENSCILAAVVLQMRVHTPKGCSQPFANDQREIMSAAEIPIKNTEPFKASTTALEQPEYLPSEASEPSGTSASIGRWLGQTQSELKSRVSSAYKRSRRATAYNRWSVR